MAALGDCYEAGGKFMMDNCMIGKCNYILVHGEVTGQGPLEGVKYGHCWIEDGDMVIDKSNGRDLRLPKQVYYALGGIDDGQSDGNTYYEDEGGRWEDGEWVEDEMFDPDNMGPTKGPNLHKYTWEQARKKIMEYEHWGPWDLVTETGL